MIIELDYGKIYRKALHLMVKTMVSCRFSLKPIQWYEYDPSKYEALDSIRLQDPWVLEVETRSKSSKDGEPLWATAESGV